ncbi:MAG: aminotransferase class I/II-fold pyridoxal phosphate-dependent enzyme [Limisphaerales bacterium]
MSDCFAEPLQQVDRTRVLWRGCKFSYFAGCDYLRLSSHPAILQAVRKSLDEFGLNVSASRKTTGNHRVYTELETATRRFFGADAAILTSSGYLTNIIAAQGMRERIAHVLLDERAHGSLRDALVFLGCPVTEFAHLDPRDLAKKIPRGIARDRLALFTDGMFSHSGAVPPLAEYRRVLGPGALLWIDDAHAAGILGAKGRGSVEECGLDRHNVIQTITYSKAFGTYGGAILCEKAVAADIVEKSCAVVGNTPLPLPLASASLAALKLCTAALRKKLFGKIELFWNELGAAPPGQLSPIISVAPNNAGALRRRLIAAGIYPPLIHYPGGPERGYFRFAISSEHSAAQIKQLATVLTEFTRQTAVR